VGDAAAFADPITGEGIFFALRSAMMLAQTLRESGSPAGYPVRALEDFGRELNKAAALRDRFYSPGLARRMIAYAGRSRAIRGVLADLVLGERGISRSSAGCCEPVPGSCSRPPRRRCSRPRNVAFQRRGRRERTERRGETEVRNKQQQPRAGKGNAPLCAPDAGAGGIARAVLAVAQLRLNDENGGRR